MVDEDELLDPQELECLLYNQVYHSFADAEPAEIFPKPADDKDMNTAGRYFHNDTGDRQPHFSLPGGIPSLNYSLDSQNNIFSLQNRGFTLPHMLLSPINNIVLLPNPPTQVFISNNENKRKKRWRKKKKKQTAAATNNPSGSNDKKEPKKQTETVEVISLCDDSNDSDVCCIEAKPPLVLLSSDDETKPKKKEMQETKPSEPVDNDVVFVPTRPKELEIIEIDDEVAKPPENIPAETVPTHQTPEHQPAVHKEVLDTPESTMSNDFLENASELTHSKFNFSLHGVDFNAKDLSKPLNKAVTERSETESSASDVSTPMKTSVFNEVPFETPTKNIFNENNLENFAEFIVPKRSVKASTPMNEEKRIGSVSKKTVATSSSESSSESDYEEVGVRKKARLPSLSVFESEAAAPKKSEDEPDCTTVLGSTDNTACASDHEESKVNAVEATTSGIKTDRNVELVDDDSALSEHDDDEPYEICASESDSSTAFNMEGYITIDEDFDETLVERNDFKRESEEEDAQVIDSSDSSESIFDMDDLKTFEEDLQIVNCEETSVKGHEPRDETLDKDKYSFDTVWTEDKEKFYKDSWGHENLSVSQVQKTMSDDPKMWKILDVDKEYPVVLSPKKRLRCWKCREHHHAYQCPKLAQPKCVLCGIRGHLEPRCPNKVCTMCGRRGNYTTTYCSMCNRDRYRTCRLCKMQGHIETRCPDLWRRYFLTTTDGPVVRPQGPDMKEDSKLCCSGCAQFGHLEHACGYYNRSHPPTNPAICRYDDVYGSGMKRNDDVRNEDDLRNKIQNKARKLEEECDNDGNFSFYKSFVEYKEGKTRSNLDSHAQPIFERNKDLASQNEIKRQELSFANAATQNTTKTKPELVKKTLLVNPLAPNVSQPRPETETNMQRFLSGTDVVFNGFEPEQPPGVIASKDYIPTKVRDMRKFLRYAFNRIKASWRLNVSEIWAQLKAEEACFNMRPTEKTHNTIRVLFERLHIILFGIGRYMEGGKCVTTLKRWQEKLSKMSGGNTLSNRAREEIKRSYDYIFGNARRDIDYKQLIGRIEQRKQDVEYLKQIDKDYDFFKRNSDGTEYKKLHVWYDRIKSSGNNKGGYVKRFRKTYKDFCNDLYRNKPNLRSENN